MVFKEIDIVNQIVTLLEESQTTVLKLYYFVNGEGNNPTKAQYEKFKKELINSVKRKKENALNLFPIIKYFESKRMTEDDLKANETLFTVPTEEKIAIASPIKVLDEVPDSKEYDLTVLWDLSKVEERESQLFKAVENYFNIVKDDENLKKFIRHIGTYVDENLELVEQEKDLFMENIPQETFALYQSSDLNNLIPNEIAQLDDLDLEIIFLKNYIEQKLLTYQLWGIERELQEEWIIRQKDVGEKGPIFICLDTSGSMRNMKEIISKALTLVFVKELEKLNINIVFIPFSMDAKFYDLYNSQVKFKTVKMNLRKSFYGGTDLENLFTTIESVIHKNKYNKANILIMSDFVFKKLPKNILKKIKNIKDAGHKLHSLAINDQNYNNDLLKHLNTNWSYTYNWKSNAEVIEDELINELMSATTLTTDVIDTVQTFGIIKKLKDYDFVENKEEMLKSLNEKLDLNKPIDLTALDDIPLE